MLIIPNRWKECDHMNPGVIFELGDPSNVVSYFSPYNNEKSFLIVKPEKIRCSRCGANFLASKGYVEEPQPKISFGYEELDLC